MNTITATKSVFVRARIEPSLKEKAEAIFNTLGMTATEAIRSFYSQTILNKGIPYSMNIPNKETLAVLDTDWSKEKGYTDVDALFADMDK